MTAPSASAPATTGAVGTAGTAPTSEATGSSPAPDEDDGPQAIISLAPTHTETLFAIGAGDQVIAVDDQSDFPAEAAAVSTDLSGFEPNVEAIAGYEPDLVVLSDATIQPQLESLGIAVWVGAAPATFEEAYAQIEQLGAATGHIAEAAELVAQMSLEIEAIITAVPVPEAPLTV
ncbi:MAG: ABC transporter substrate-binding protein, partial [Acidimicrobiia bacterium]|nr:ABC transporter substrate-binding protein [Acidimicrobiia bacterium]